MVFARAAVYSAAVLALASVSKAQNDNATYEQTAAIQLNFPAAGIVPTYFPESWLDIQGVLNVSFGDVAVGSIGDRLNLNQVQTAPTYRISSETKKADDRDVFDDDKLFTVAFLDTFVAGKDFGGVVNEHFLGNNFTVGDNGVLTNRTPAAVEYAAPNPPENDGPHRYIQLVIQQYPNFTAPQLNFQGTPGINQSFVDYYNSANGGLGKVVAASYIQIEVGNAPAPSSTAAVSQASVSALAASQSSGGPQASGSGSGSGTNGAMAMGSAPLAAMAGMAGAAVLGALLF